MTDCVCITSAVEYSELVWGGPCKLHMDILLSKNEQYIENGFQELSVNVDT